MFIRPSTEESKGATIFYLNRIITKFWDVAVGNRLPFPEKFTGTLSTEINASEDMNDPTPPLSKIDLFAKGENNEIKDIVSFTWGNEDNVESNVGYALALLIGKTVHPEILRKEFGTSISFNIEREESDFEL